MAAGNFRLVEHDHTVLLNWNEKTVPVLRQLAAAQRDGRETKRRPVVVLANKDKEVR